MTLHKEIKEVLKKEKRPMTANEIAAKLNKNSLYVREDKLPITGTLITARVIGCHDLFTIDRTVSPHQIRIKEDMLSPLNR